MPDEQELQTTEKAVNETLNLGDWSEKPAVPATTVTAKNTSGYTAWVEITAGTVTAVKVDGVTVGARIAGMFLVRDGSTIAWVGSAAPTWQWFLLPF
jgi:hypothetical protein